MKDRAEFFGMVSNVGKRIAHTVEWHVWHALPNAFRVLWFAPRGLWRVIRAIWDWVFDDEHSRYAVTPPLGTATMIIKARQVAARADPPTVDLAAEKRRTERTQATVRDHPVDDAARAVLAHAEI